VAKVSQTDVVDLEVILGHKDSKLYYFCVNDPNCMAKSMIGVAK
jgi:succinate dehydrogenase flavin-adding protein (antitoxin of CptAB toxin-antitoxin module)